MANIVMTASMREKNNPVHILCGSKRRLLTEVIHKAQQWLWQYTIQQRRGHVCHVAIPLQDFHLAYAYGPNINNETYRIIVHEPLPSDDDYQLVLERYRDCILQPCQKGQ